VGVWADGNPQLARQISDIDQTMREKFYMFWPKSHDSGAQWETYDWKADQKLKITGVIIAWVGVKSNEYPLFTNQNDYTIWAFTKSEPNFQDRIPRKLHENFYILIFGVIY